MARLTGGNLDIGSAFRGLPGFDWLDDYSHNTPSERQHLRARNSPASRIISLWIDADNKIPVPDSYYHVVHLGHTLSWNVPSNWVPILEEAARVVVPGGLLIIVDLFEEPEKPEVYRNLLESCLKGWCVYVAFDNCSQGLRMLAVCYKHSFKHV